MNNLEEFNPSPNSDCLIIEDPAKTQKDQRLKALYVADVLRYLQLNFPGIHQIQLPQDETKEPIELLVHSTQAGDYGEIKFVAYEQTEDFTIQTLIELIKQRKEIIKRSKNTGHISFASASIQVKPPIFARGSFSPSKPSSTG